MNEEADVHPLMREALRGINEMFGPGAKSAEVQGIVDSVAGVLVEDHRAVTVHAGGAGKVGEVVATLPSGETVVVSVALLDDHRKAFAEARS